MGWILGRPFGSNLFAGTFLRTTIFHNATIGQFLEPARRPRILFYVRPNSAGADLVKLWYCGILKLSSLLPATDHLDSTMGVLGNSPRSRIDVSLILSAQDKRQTVSKTNLSKSKKETPLAYVDY